jgi:hypothetical protein
MPTAGITTLAVTRIGILVSHPGDDWIDIAFLQRLVMHNIQPANDLRPPLLLVAFRFPPSWNTVSRLPIGTSIPEYDIGNSSTYFVIKTSPRMHR